MDMLDAEDERYLRFKDYVEGKGYQVFPLSAPINQGVHELLAAAAAELHRIEQEPQEEEIYEFFDFEKDKEDPDYREIHASKEGNNYVLEGKQLRKIFNSTNFNDFGSLRYLYKYMEKNGGIEKLKELGLEEGDTIRVFDYEFEYFDE
jgi:GTP-binding protein